MKLTEISQSLTGNPLSIREPYAVLMHHIPKLEDLKKQLENQRIELGTSSDTKLRHLQVLLDFINDQFQRLCFHANERMIQVEPTVRFEDVWFLMRPGALAYARWDRTWIGCSIEQITKLGSKQDGSAPEAWLINICFLQMSWSSGALECGSAKITINRFNGARSITSLPVFPREFHDTQDSGLRKQDAEQRGSEIAKMLWEGPKHLTYEGECMDQLRQQVSTAQRSLLMEFTEIAKSTKAKSLLTAHMTWKYTAQCTSGVSS